MKGRVKGLLGVPAPGEHPGPMHAALTDASPEAAAQHQALQVLTLAQRTAEDHLNSARLEADRIRAEARDSAEKIVRDAQARAEALKREADKALSDAHAAAAQIGKDAKAHADRAQRDAEKILADARSRAGEIGKAAQADADELKHLAQQRYDDVVGSLATRREGLQQQIEALEQFDREYRLRLQAFLQSQLRALWVDQPKVDPEAVEQPPAVAVPAQRDKAEPETKRKTPVS